MNVFEKLKNGDPVDMYSEEYRPVIEELYRTDSCLFRLNHAPPRSDEQQRALEELFCGQVPQGLGLFTPVHMDFPMQITFGRHVFINHSFTAMSVGGIEFGDDVQIGPNVTIVTTNHDLKDRNVLRCRGVVIASGVWIGAGACIMPGVHIGERAVVAGGSVVTKDVPPLAVVGGNPAGIIRYITEEDD